MMKPVEQVLTGCVRPKSTRYTERRIVVLRKNADYRKCLRQLAASGIQPVKTVSGARLICCYADKRQKWKELRNHPMVAYVEKDEKVSAHGSSVWLRSRPDRPSSPKRSRNKIPWNVCRVESPEVWSQTRGETIKLAVIDTGIAPHPDLRIAGGVNTMGGTSYKDDNGHGTHVAGIAAATGNVRIFGNAPNVRLYAVKALDRRGDGFVSDIAEGIDWCIANGIRVINMSFGLPSDNRTLREAVKRARKRGIVMVASAGNEDSATGEVDYPARYAETIAVAATTRSNRIASFSSRGAGIDVSAPGVNILSTYLYHTYVRMSGTSMSAPHVSGAAALLRALRPKLGPAAVSRLIRASARRLPGFAPIAAGSGLLQTAKAAAIARRRAACSPRNAGPPGKAATK